MIVYDDNRLAYTTARTVSRLPWVCEDAHEIQLDRIREIAEAKGGTYRLIADERAGEPVYGPQCQEAVIVQGRVFSASAS